MTTEPGCLTAATSEWEAVCQRCGRCCYEKYDYRGTIYYTKTPCGFLDPATNSCRIYPQRQRLQPECARLTPDLVRMNILPDDCPYRRFVDRDG